MARRACLVCGHPTEGTRCPRHRRTNNSTARGYGIAHQRVRAHLATTLPARCGDHHGETLDPYCGETITPADHWVAAHVVDGHPEHGYVVAHPGCNERAKRRD